MKHDGALGETLSIFYLFFNLKTSYINNIKITDPCKTSAQIARRKAVIPCTIIISIFFFYKVFHQNHKLSSQYLEFLLIYIFFKSQGVKVGPVYGINLHAPPLRFGNSYYRLCTTTACFREVLPFVIATCHFSLSTQLNASTLANAYKQLALVSRTITTVRYATLSQIQDSFFDG